MQYQAEVFQFTSQMEFIKYISIQTHYFGKFFWLMVYKKLSWMHLWKKKNHIAVFIPLKYMYFLKPDQGTVKCYPWEYQNTQISRDFDDWEIKQTAK